jgi:TolA-binding protein
MTGARLPSSRLFRLILPLALLPALIPGGAVRAEETAAKTEEEAAVVPAAAPAPAPAAEKAVDEIQGRLNLGVSLTNRGQYDDAEIAYRQVLNAPEAGPTEIKTALLGLAHMHRRQGALTKAVAIYEKFLKEYPGDERTPDALLELGRTLRDMGAYRLATSRFYSLINSTLKLPGGNFDRYQQLAKTAQFEIAETHFQAGEFEEAAKFFTRLRLLDLTPEDQARAQFKAGYALHLQGDEEGAVTTLRTFLAQYPNDENVPEARYLLAVGLRALGRSDDAFVATLELLRAEKSRLGADPKRWAYWQGRTGNQLANDFFLNGDVSHASRIYAGLIELSPELSWRLPILYQIALCQERLGDIERAQAAYRSIIDGAGKNPSPELAELARMAAWRLEHLDWSDQVGRQMARIFRPGVPATVAANTPPAKPSASSPASAHD